jgi:hypothetical protein
MLALAGALAACGSTAPVPRAPETTAAEPPAPPAPTPSPSATSSTTAAASAPGAAAPGAAQARPTKIGARHVLIQWMGCEHAATSVVRTREQALAVAKEVLRRARAGEDLGRLAVEFSDEPNAAQRGGSLGRFGKGQMVHAFEEAAFALEPGQISDIVETGFGFHVIQRTE